MLRFLLNTLLYFVRLILDYSIDNIDDNAIKHIDFIGCNAISLYLAWTTYVIKAVVTQPPSIPY